MDAAKVAKEFWVAADQTEWGNATQSRMAR
jgi:hypothetical protein